MNIGIDFDDTLSREPAMWKALYDSAKLHGHQMWCVSCRRNTTENDGIINEFLDAHEMQMPVMLTSLQGKQRYMEGLGIHIDIWIDDMPRSIAEGR
jgi:hypothetical protein